MKFPLALAAACALSVLSANAETTALVGGTVINPRDGKIIPRAVVVLEGDRIASVSSRQEKEPPADAHVVDCTGKFVLPGYIDTHVHFFQSGDLFARPDVVDLNRVRPYKDEVAWTKSHLDDTFARYLRCGITSVIDVGGPRWNFEVRKRAQATARAPRVAVAGPLISSVARPQLELEGDPPIVKIKTPAQGIAPCGFLRSPFIQLLRRVHGCAAVLLRARTDELAGAVPRHGRHPDGARDKTERVCDH